MDRPFPAYKGDEPFLFICYAHADAERVYALMSAIHDAGQNIWYDEGISAGNVWRGEIARAIGGAHQVIFFASPAAVASQHCNSEIHYAFDRDIPVLPVYLEETQLPDDLLIGLSRIQAITAESGADEQTLKTLLEIAARVEPAVKPLFRWYKSWRLWSGLVATLLLVLCLIAYQLLFAPVESSFTAPADIAPPAAELSEHVSVQPLSAIAVMPLANNSPDGDNQWLVDGMQVALIDALSRTPEFHVPGRLSVNYVADAKLSLEDIGRKLRVGTVIEGSLLRRGNDVRINLNVIKVADGSQLWSGAFNRKMDDVFDLQEEIGIAVAEALRAELDIDLTKSYSLARYRTQDIRAYELITKVESMLNPLTAGSDKGLLREINTLIDEALLIDPNYPDALYQKGRFYWHSNKPEQAKAIADQLFAAAGENVGTLILLARLAEREMKWAEALAHLARAVELTPWDGGVHVYYGGLLQQTFQLEEGLQHLRRAAQLDPLNPFIRWVLGTGETASGNYEQASDQFYLATELGHSDSDTPLLLARSLYLSGRKVEAASSMLDWFMGIPPLRAFILTQPDMKAYLEAGDLASMLKLWLATESFCSRGDYFMLWYAEFNDRDGLYRCTTNYLAVGNVAPIGILHNISLRPYLHDERMKPLLKARNLLAYLPEAIVSDGVQ